MSAAEALISDAGPDAPESMHKSQPDLIISFGESCESSAHTFLVLEKTWISTKKNTGKTKMNDQK